jgi:hypothetical protein
MWWRIADEMIAKNALSEIMGIISSEAIPLLNASGKIFGFEINRDETRLILLTRAGAKQEIEHRLAEYETRWKPSGAISRASNFLKICSANCR